FGRQFDVSIGAADRQKHFFALGLESCDVRLDFSNRGAHIRNELDRREAAGRFTEREVDNVEVSGDIPEPDKAGTIIKVMQVTDDSPLRKLPAAAATATTWRRRIDRITRG